MPEDTTEAGYEAAKAGKPDQPELKQFTDGWNCYYDYMFWEERAEVLGLKVHGWSCRSSCSFFHEDTKTIIQWSDTLKTIHDKLRGYQDGA